MNMRAYGNVVLYGILNGKRNRSEEMKMSITTADCLLNKFLWQELLEVKRKL